MLSTSRSAVSKFFFFVCLWFLLLALAPIAQAQTSYTGNVDFGTVNLGASGGIQTLTFSFSSPTSLNVTIPVQVLTTGVTGLDFKNAGTGSCGGSTYSTCTVDVVFSPQAPGLRLGAVVIKDASGNVLSTAYIHGVGHGPQAGFDTSGMTAIGGAAKDPNGLATDAAGNVYIADASSEMVYKVTPDGTATPASPSFAYGPDGVAVDGAGNVYTAVGHFTQIAKTTPAGVTTMIGNVVFPGGMAVDGLGNLYITESGVSTQSGNGDVVKLAPDGTQTRIGTGLAQPAGVAVDASGNVLIANTGGGTIVKVAPDNTQTTLVSGLSYPGGIAVDPGGNLYVPLELGGEVVEYSPNGTQLRTFGANQLSGPSAVALDYVGNIYVNSGSFTYKIARTPPTIGFVTSAVNTKSSDSPRSFTLENIGNDIFTIPALTSTANPQITTPDFTIDAASTCPILTSSSQPAGTLATGASCIYAIDFIPTASGTLTSSLILTDNSLNVANGTQTIPLNNQGTPVIIFATVTVNDVFANYNGSPMPVTVTTNPAGLAVNITYGPYGGATTNTTPPTLPGLYSVSAVITTPGYSGSGTGLVIINAPPAPVITWAAPAPITVGTPLSATQLNATSTTAGTITYSIPSGTVLAVGSYAITATLTPSDTSGAYPVTTKTVTLVVQQNVQAVTPVNFNTVDVGSTSAAQTVSFNFANPVTLGSTPVQVLTQGIAGLDFKNTNAGSCAAGSYAANAICTVTVNFTPAAPGPRLGSVVLLDASGNVLATAFIGGVGQGPQIVYDPGVKSIFAPSIATYGLAIDAAGNAYLNELNDIVKVTPGGVQTVVAPGPGSASLGTSGATAIDGAGNLYTLDLANSIVYEVTPGGTKYQLGSGWVYPIDLTVDTAGNLYVVDRGYNPPPDTTGGRLSKITAAGVQTSVAGPFVNPEGVAVDSAGNIYVTDNAGLGIINPGLIGVLYKVTPGGTRSTVASGLFSPGGVAVDAAGDLFVVAASTNASIDRITPAGVRTKLYDGQVSFPETVKIASSGDVYITQGVSGAQLVKFDRSTVPSLSFASTAVGSTSSDSPQTVAVENIGNATLNLSAPGTGTNASISTNFTLGSTTTCPHAATASTLTSGSSCLYAVQFVPTGSGPLTGSLILTDNALNVANATQSIALSGTGTVSTTSATVTLGGLNQTYTGSPLSVTATTNPTGLTVSITYNGSAAPPTAAGSYNVVATVTSTGYTGSTTGVLAIAKATPAITWATPAGIASGTALSATQLNATASVPGTLVYTPAAGSTPATGTDTLSVLFTPTDTTDYTTATKSVSLAVGQATPVIAWANPAAVSYGTTLSAIQLNATASVPGTLVYTPALGSTPAAGTDTLSVTFTPTDTTDYTTATKTVSLIVNQATPVITWSNPAAIPYGTALSATQLDAAASVPGTFAYSPAAGATPAAGTVSLAVTFTPTDTIDYTTATKTVSLAVGQATPVITWANPASITYGTVLGSTQLNATASIPGTFVYTPAAGSTPAQGTDTLSVTFTPTDTTDYTTATKTVSLVVSAATPVITWASPAAITYGTALNATQLNATASVPGTFTYSPAAGTILTAGAYIITATFTPTDTASYGGATKTAGITVNPASLGVAANNATRMYGTANPAFTGALSGSQNNDALTESFATTAITLSNVGTYAIVPSVSGTNLASYTQTVTNGSLSITQAGSTTTFSVGSTSVAAGQSVTLTAQVVSATSGTPTGGVQFYDGTTLLNTATLASGTATYATTTLSAGATHSLTAVYLGDTNFTGSNGGAAKTITVTGSLDFTLTPITLSNTVIPGNAAAYSFQIAPASGSVYPANVVFTATGLPSGATATFSPATIAANGGPQTVTVSIQTSQSGTAPVRTASNAGRNLAGIAFALVLLPFAGASRLRQSGKRLGRLFGLVLLFAAGAAFTVGLTGCGSHNGYFGQAPQTYTVTLTATSGTVQHSTTVTLNVQ